MGVNGETSYCTMCCEIHLFHPAVAKSVFTDCTEEVKGGSEDGCPGSPLLVSVSPETPPVIEGLLPYMGTIDFRPRPSSFGAVQTPGQLHVIIFLRFLKCP